MTTQRKVLLVEDNDDTRRLYSIVLRYHGFQVQEAVTGVEAVRMVRESVPDLVLMDLALPVMDGWEAARRIKADPAIRHVPVIAFSALIDCTADLRADASTFDGFIAKPVSPSELVVRVERFLELAAAPMRTAAELAAEAPLDLVGADAPPVDPSVPLTNG